MIKKKHLLIGSAISFFIFVVFSYVVHKNYFTQFDFDITIKLQDHISRRFDGFFSLLSTLGNAECAGVILFIILCFHRKLKSFLILLFFAAFHLFEVYGKTFVNHLPPPHFMLRTQQLVNFPQFYVSAENSYPSGHAARAIFLTTILFLITYHSAKLGKYQKVFVYGFLALYDIVMLVSRPYLGEHWTSDVIGGSLLGLSFALAGGVFL